MQAKPCYEFREGKRLAFAAGEDGGDENREIHLLFLVFVCWTRVSRIYSRLTLLAVRGMNILLFHNHFSLLTPTPHIVEWQIEIQANTVCKGLAPNSCKLCTPD